MRNSGNFWFRLVESVQFIDDFEMNIFVEVLAHCQSVGRKLSWELATPSVEDEARRDCAGDAGGKLLHLVVQFRWLLIADGFVIKQAVNFIIDRFRVQGDERLLEGLVVTCVVRRLPCNCANPRSGVGRNAVEENDALFLLLSDLLPREEKFQHLEPGLRIRWQPGWSLELRQLDSSGCRSHC